MLDERCVNHQSFWGNFVNKYTPEELRRNRFFNWSLKPRRSEAAKSNHAVLGETFCASCHGNEHEIGAAAKLQPGKCAECHAAAWLNGKVSADHYQHSRPEYLRTLPQADATKTVSREAPAGKAPKNLPGADSQKKP